VETDSATPSRSPSSDAPDPLEEEPEPPTGFPRGFLHETRAFFVDLWGRVARSDLFFMAGAITFNVLVAFVPLLLLVVGISGYVLAARYEGVTPELLDFLFRYLPAVRGDIDLSQTVGALLEGVVAERTGLSLVGVAILAWISTRLVATLRVVLRNVFDIGEDRGILAGKLFDLKVVALGGLLLLLNVAATVGLRTVRAFGVMVLEPGGRTALAFQWILANVAVLLSAWVLFYLLYRYVPARKVAWRTAMVGATFTAILYELMKGGFAWYVTSVADFGTAYGNLAVVAVLFIWIYYGSVVFVLGGLVARTYESRREVRMKTKRRIREGAAAAVILAGALALPGGLGAQVLAPFGGNGNGGGNGGGLLNPGEPVVFADRSLEREMVVDRPLVDHAGAYVVVHLAENRVFVMEGREVVWSAPAGTGHGFQLEGQGHEWTFTTPVGMFQVLRREKDPVWLAPDWYYVQRGMRIPSSSADRLRIPGTLGTSALFLGDGIAIHGTDRPDLLLNTDPEARRVSHGCIRLTNEAARQLYHLVDVGTPVLIY
jgi:membrane protein